MAPPPPPPVAVVPPPPGTPATPDVAPLPPADKHWRLSAERLFGIGVWNVSESQNGQSAGTNGVSFSLLTGATSPDAFSAYTYQTPRLAVDYELSSHITLGGALGLFLGNSSQSPSGQGGPGLFMYLVALRGGYFWSLSDSWAFWPRAGLTFYQYQQGNSSGGTTTTLSQSGIAIDLEPTLVFKAYSVAGFTASALADIGVSGGTSQSVGGTSGSVSTTASNYGLTFGMYVAF